MNSVHERTREMLRAGGSIDDVLGVMRREDLSQIASMRLLIELTGMNLREAKTAVHLSPVWAEIREGNDTFHEQLERAAQQCSAPDDPIAEPDCAEVTMTARLPLDFINSRVEVSWSDLACALERQLISPTLAIQMARQLIATRADPTIEEQRLAESSASDPIRSLVDVLAQSDKQDDPSRVESKWLYLLLAWLFENRESVDDPLRIVEEIYAEFGYPPEMAALVRYMPMAGPDLGSKALNESRIYTHWQEYLDAAAARFRPTA